MLVSPDHPPTYTKWVATPDQMDIIIVKQTNEILQWDYSTPCAKVEARLSYNHFKSIHTGENILQNMKTQSLLLTSLPKSRMFVTDHASNMPKAFNLPGYQENADDCDEEEDDEMIALSKLIVIHLI